MTGQLKDVGGIKYFVRTGPTILVHYLCILANEKTATTE